MSHSTGPSSSKPTTHRFRKKIEALMLSTTSDLLGSFLLGAFMLSLALLIIALHE